jgi:hypothetical protein
VQLRLLLWDLSERKPIQDPKPLPKLEVDWSQAALDKWRNEEGRKLELRGNLRGMVALFAIQALFVSVALATTVNKDFFFGVFLTLFITLIMAGTSKY